MNLSLSDSRTRVPRMPEHCIEAEQGGDYRVSVYAESMQQRIEDHREPWQVAEVLKEAQS